MSQMIKAAVFHRPEEPLEVQALTLDEPGDHEVVVRTVATGVCHSDLHVADGSIYVGRRDVVLGHEGAGVVEAVGAAVRAVAPGDHVVACLSGFCGACEQCLAGHPNVCVGDAVARPRGMPPRVSRGDEGLVAFAGIGSFAERMLVHENSVVKVDPEIPLDVAALVGCGVLTGVGAALRTARVEAGDLVAVFGCGGVGLSIVQGARIAGASRIIAVDRVASKLDLARAVGATDVVDASGGDAVAAVRELTRGRGVDHAFEAVGNAALVRQATEVLAVRGTCTIVGVPADGTVFEVPYAAIRPECRVQTSRMGSNRFRVDIPRYLDFYRQGRLLLDELVTRRARLEDVNEAFRAMQAGEVARTVLLFD
jgi:S-(hydroxymethyl)glutathione dehydrogenase/alcohol dehydrogenase